MFCKDTCSRLVVKRHCACHPCPGEACRCLVAQLCPTLCSPMDCRPPGSSVHGISQAGIQEWVAIPTPGDLPDPGMEPASSASAGGFLAVEPPGRPLGMIANAASVALAPLPPNSLLLFHQDKGSPASGPPYFCPSLRLERFSPK